MNHGSHSLEPSLSPPLPPPERARRRRGRPAIALVLLAPVIAELLYGATRISTIFVLIPEIMTWGCGALLIRECVRRWNKGWQSMLLLGIAVAVAEEWLIQQTSISPLVRAGQQGYGRVWGVNWVYLLWALGYESVWVVLLPVQLTELMYPDRRRTCWLRTRGLILAGLVFLAGAFAAWYGWTHRARVAIFHMAPYSPPPVYSVIGAAAVLALVIAALMLPPSQAPERSIAPRSTLAPWVVGAVSCALGTPWAAFAVAGWGTGALRAVPFQAVLLVGLAWGCFTYFLMRRWTSRPDWSDAHRFALVCGGVLACMLGGFVVFKTGGAPRMDWLGKIVLNAAAIAWLIRIGRNRRFTGLEPW